MTETSPLHSEGDGNVPPPSLNLRQRILAIMDEIGTVKATGKTPQGIPTMSIGDVEEVLAPLLVRHGVVVRQSVTDVTLLPESVWETTFKGKSIPSWIVVLNLTYENADDPSDFFEDMAQDTGPNVSAAVSYAVKRNYRTVFHLADDDGRGNVEVATPPPAPKKASAPKPAPAPAPAAPAPPKTSDTGFPCPNCGHQTMVSLYNKGQWYCANCKWKGPSPAGGEIRQPTPAERKEAETLAPAKRQGIGPAPRAEKLEDAEQRVDNWRRLTDLKQQAAAARATPDINRELTERTIQIARTAVNTRAMQNGEEPDDEELDRRTDHLLQNMAQKRFGHSWEETTTDAECQQIHDSLHQWLSSL